MIGARTTGRCLAVLCASIAATLAWSGSAVAAWVQPVGGSSPINQASDRNAIETSLAVIGGAPYVAWREFDGGNFEVRVSRLNAAGTAWEQVVGGASPINVANDKNAFDPMMVAFGDVPYVAWAEFDGVNDEIRVSRLNATGTAWEQVVGGASPINHAADKTASKPNLAVVGGVLHVAWRENDGVNAEVRVSRLNAAGTAWEQLVGGASPINQAADQSADDPRLTAIGDVPYVAWREPDATNTEIRVSRLNAAGTAWEQVVGGASPINESSTLNAFGPSLASIGGVPHIAWSEDDGGSRETRVSRLNAAGTDWQQLVGGASPINHSTSGISSEPILVSIGGVPYVAWREDDADNDNVRVSRLNAAGTAWEEVVGGDSPINQSSAQDAAHNWITDVGGVPYVSWTEADDDLNNETRVARLEPEFLGVSQTVTDTAATLAAEVRTFGVAYPIGFEFGPAAGFGSQALPVVAQSGNADSATATRTITGLTPLTDYSWRPFGTDLSRPTGIGPTSAFRTTGPGPAPLPPPPPPPPPGVVLDTVAPVLTGVAALPRVWSVDPNGVPEARIARRRRAPRGTTFRYTLSEPARVVFTIRRRTRGRRVGGRCRKQTRRNRRRRACTRFVRRGRFAHASTAGLNRKRFSGRIGRSRLRIGRYRTTLVATDAAGNRSRPRRVTLRVVRR